MGIGSGAINHSTFINPYILQIMGQNLKDIGLALVLWAVFIIVVSII